jgi:hypothetical protein
MGRFNIIVVEFDHTNIKKIINTKKEIKPALINPLRIIGA